ncbi:MAG: HdeD family acid-resistance protein [Ruegeria sp.]
MTDQDPKTGEIMDDGSMQGRDALGAQLADLWWTFLIRGILAACVGVAALFWPSGSIAVLLRLVGLLLIVDGGLTVLGFGRRGLVGGVGIGAILIGLILLIWPEGTAKLAFFLLGVWAFIIGIGSLATWRQMPERDTQRNAMRNSGFVALAIGLLLLFSPGIGLFALGWIIAFSALAMAVVMFWLTSHFKKAGDKVGMKTINR